MKLTFLGTRGGIIARSKEHYMESVLQISYRKTSILIDWGSDWLEYIPPLVDGLLITHAHSDHVGGLKEGFPTAVYTTEDTLERIQRYPLDVVPIFNKKKFSIGSLTIEPFEVYHSLRAPAVGFKITGGKKTLFYVSDLVGIVDPRVLRGVDLYIGDGAIISRNLLKRTKDGTPTGHCSIREQLLWCKKYGIGKAIFTHCGSEIVKGSPQVIQEKIDALEEETGIKTLIAHDGMIYT